MDKQEYHILLEDKGESHNISCHTFQCEAVSMAEAVGKMYFLRPDFRTRRVNTITCEGVEVFIDPYYKESIERATETLKERIREKAKK